MTLGKALYYFAREALLNLFRSWKTSLLAVTTIAVSLFIGGFFLMLAANASRLIEDWKSEAMVVVYFAPTTDLNEVDAARSLAGSPAWVEGVDEVTAPQARERFRASFPSVATLVEGWEEEPLPASLEVSFDPLLVEDHAFEAWLGELEELPEVELVDDDRDWVDQLELALQLVLGLGLALGAVLLGAAILTIASVIRLTAILYQDEIDVMRLVGATEFYLRGPFYVEGLWQGLLGGLVALGALFGGFVAVQPMAEGSLLLGTMGTTFLAWPQQVLLVGVGAVAGLLGAIFSLRREAI